MSTFYLTFLIFTAVKNRCILHGHVSVMEILVAGAAGRNKAVVLVLL